MTQDMPPYNPLDLTHEKRPNGVSERGVYAPRGGRNQAAGKVLVASVLHLSCDVVDVTACMVDSKPCLDRKGTRKRKLHREAWRSFLARGPEVFDRNTDVMLLRTCDLEKMDEAASEDLSGPPVRRGRRVGPGTRHGIGARW